MHSFIYVCIDLQLWTMEMFTNLIQYYVRPLCNNNSSLTSKIRSLYKMDLLPIYLMRPFNSYVTSTKFYDSLNIFVTGKLVKKKVGENGFKGKVAMQ